MNSTQNSGKHLECGCRNETQPTTTLPAVGEVCERCRRPIQLQIWPFLARTHQYDAAGTTIHEETWLVGIDTDGRALYHDTRANELLTVALAKHPSFDEDVTSENPPMRPYTDDDQSSGVLTAGTGHAMVVVDRQPADLHSHDELRDRTPHLAYRIARRLRNDTVDILTGTAIRALSPSPADITDELLAALTTHLDRFADTPALADLEPPLNFIHDARDFLDQHQ